MLKRTPTRAGVEAKPNPVKPAADHHRDGTQKRNVGKTSRAKPITKPIQDQPAAGGGKTASSKNSRAKARLTPIPTVRAGDQNYVDTHVRRVAKNTRTKAAMLPNVVASAPPKPGHLIDGNHALIAGQKSADHPTYATHTGPVGSSLLRAKNMETSINDQRAPGHPTGGNHTLTAGQTSKRANAGENSMLPSRVRPANHESLPTQIAPGKSSKRANMKMQSTARQPASDAKLPSPPTGDLRRKNSAANAPATPGNTPPQADATNEVKPSTMARPHSTQANGEPLPIAVTPDADDQPASANHARQVVGKSSRRHAASANRGTSATNADDHHQGDVHIRPVVGPHSPAVALIQELHRDRQGFARAEKSLTLQIRAICRRLCGGDKDAAAPLYASLDDDDETHPLKDAATARTAPFFTARSVMNTNRREREKQMEKLARTLPAYKFVESIRGIGDLSFAQIIGETGDLSIYRNPAKVWKRLGLAVFDGRAQRRHKGMDQSEGYSPERRSIVWNVGEAIVKHRGEPYRSIYDERKAYEHARNPEITKMWAHNRAKRYMEKRVIRDLFRAWRDELEAKSS